MLRLRRYRVFVACATIFMFLVYRVAFNSAWDEASDAQYAAAALPNTGRNAPQSGQAQKPLANELPSSKDTDEEASRAKLPDLKPNTDKPENHALPASAPIDGGAAAALAPAANIPDRVPGKVVDAYVENTPEALHIQKPPGGFQPSVTVTPPIHWSQLPERFPVDPEFLISLPTGHPKSIPAVQHKFETEAEDAKQEREDRLAIIKAEMKRAWTGYTTFAFGHDEVMPMSKSFRDPFCGWAATLVDAMDTLWIMGLTQEFDEAYEGLKNIDFTTTFRNDIPVFETTIRYLGGLIAAYDVTGGHKGDYPLLLKKAVELAEILMGVFDTPNRMPILYYNWKPAFVSQPHRAGVRSGVAEFGTLSMEFTRLAQLTGKDKYYDAIARITDALDEWQNRGDDTTPFLDGIFPETIDASGCNKTATSVRNQAQEKTLDLPEPQGYVPNRNKAPPIKRRDETGKLEETSKQKLGSPYKAGSSNRSPTQQSLAADGLPANWDCVAQNLTAPPGSQSYSMGGSQDSAYEYFPKQYLLLGGLEEKYRALHENTVAAVKKHLLYRPMVKDEDDILFSAKVRVSANKDLDLASRVSREFEVTHLTCFLGGMFAMGGKIFESAEDVNIGRRLTDGCVWAYSSMPAGVMAEYAQVIPCENTQECHWNETAWHLSLDPNPDFRDQQMQGYVDSMALWETQKEEALHNEAVRQLEAESPTAKAATEAENPTGDSDVRPDDNGQHSSKSRKRDIEAQDSTATPSGSSTLDPQAIEERMKKIEANLDTFGRLQMPADPAVGSFGGTPGQVPIKSSFKLPPKPWKPQTHEEYVEGRILNEALPPGYTTIGSSAYQLRPEAIESVWYMYRITGETEWQDKGWKMWEAVMKHTRTDIANAALNGVNLPGGPHQQDNMESFWLAETLKYFYLLYAEPDVISLDDWVLNTEAHPFKRPA